MEEEARQILATGLAGRADAMPRRGAPPVEGNVAALIRGIVDPAGGVDLDLPARSDEWDPPRVDEDRP